MTMKNLFLLVFLFLTYTVSMMAQEDSPQESNGANRLQERMAIYIQKRLELTKSEAEKFNPIFLRYIIELRKTHRDNKGDRPMLQLKVAELRIRFRNEFREIMDDQRANRVFDYQREFEHKVMNEIRQRRQENRPGARQQAVIDRS